MQSLPAARQPKLSSANEDNDDDAEEADEADEDEDDDDDDDSDDPTAAAAATAAETVTFAPSLFPSRSSVIRFDYPHALVAIGIIRPPSSSSSSSPLLLRPSSTSSSSSSSSSTSSSSSSAAATAAACFYKCGWERNCVKGAFHRAGLRRKLSGKVWSACWTKHLSPLGFAAVVPKQKVNHFPGSWCLGRKDRLIRTIGAMARSKSSQQQQSAQQQKQQQQQYVLNSGGGNDVGKQTAAFDFVPDGWILPHDYEAFMRAARMSFDNNAAAAVALSASAPPPTPPPPSPPQQQTFASSLESSAAGGEGPRPDPPKYPAATATGTARQQSSSSQPTPSTLEVFILKPSAAACGRGIRLIHSNNLSSVPSSKPCIIQRYLPSPYIINGKKFDLRIYVLVTSFSPLRAYTFEEGLARFGTKDYSLENLNSRYAHLTNYSINKKSKDFVPPSADDGGGTSASSSASSAQDDKADKDQESSKWSLTSLWRHLIRKEGEASVKRCQTAVKRMLVKTLIAGEAEIAPAVQRHVKDPNSCFELFGFDVFLDHELRPWLIEVNVSPSLMGTSALDQKIKGALMADVFHLVGVRPYEEDKKPTTLPDYSNPPRGGVGGVGVVGGDKDATTSSVKSTLQDAFRRDPTNPHAVSLQCLTIADWEQVCTLEDELDRRGHFTPIFPARECVDLLKLFKSPRFNNALLAKWLLDGRELYEQGLAAVRCGGKARARLDAACLKADKQLQTFASLPPTSKNVGALGGSCAVLLLPPQAVLVPGANCPLATRPLKPMPEDVGGGGEDAWLIPLGEKSVDIAKRDLAESRARDRDSRRGVGVGIVIAAAASSSAAGSHAANLASAPAPPRRSSSYRSSPVPSFRSSPVPFQPAATTYVLSSSSSSSPSSSSSRSSPVVAPSFQSYVMPATVAPTLFARTTPRGAGLGGVPPPRPPPASSRPTSASEKRLGNDAGSTHPPVAVSRPSTAGRSRTQSSSASTGSAAAAVSTIEVSPEEKRVLQEFNKEQQLALAKRVQETRIQEQLLQLQSNNSASSNSAFVQMIEERKMPREVSASLGPTTTLYGNGGSGSPAAKRGSASEPLVKIMNYGDIFTDAKDIIDKQISLKRATEARRVSETHARAATTNLPSNNTNYGSVLRSQTSASVVGGKPPPGGGDMFRIDGIGGVLANMFSSSQRQKMGS